MNTNVVLYNGPPANVIIATELVELDHSAGNPLAVIDKIAGVLEDGAELLKTAGGLTGNDVLSGYGREVGTVADTYKRLEGNSIIQQIVLVFDSPDDPYPPGLLKLDWVSLLTQAFIAPNRTSHQFETSLSSIPCFFAPSMAQERNADETLQAGMAQRSTPKKVLTRSDDPHSLVWTESITVRGTDDGGDLGVYAFYFNVNVTDISTPL